MRCVNSLWVYRSWEARLSSASSYFICPFPEAQQAEVPCWKCPLDEFLNSSINFTVFVRVKSIDVAREFDASILLEFDVGGQPLILSRPVRVEDPVQIYMSIEPFWIGRVITGYDLSLATPSIDGVLNAHYFVAETTRFTIDEGVERRINEVSYPLIGQGVPIRTILLMLFKLGKGSSEFIMEALVDEGV
jgi:hypothetical protein